MTTSMVVLNPDIIAISAANGMLSGTVKNSSGVGLAASVLVVKSGATDVYTVGRTETPSGTFSLPVSLNENDRVTVLAIPDDPNIKAMVSSSVTPG